jgi:CRP/FNR family transcriptional regulator, cyclic AMP receptor protein
VTLPTQRRARRKADRVAWRRRAHLHRFHSRPLLLLPNIGKHGGPEPITTPISQETLAEIIGTTRSRVSQFMNKFGKLGFIEYNGHLEIHSSLLSVLLRE